MRKFKHIIESIFLILSLSHYLSYGTWIRLFYNLEFDDDEFVSAVIS